MKQNSKFTSMLGENYLTENFDTHVEIIFPAVELRNLGTCLLKRTFGYLKLAIRKFVTSELVCS